MFFAQLSSTNLSFRPERFCDKQACAIFVKRVYPTGPYSRKLLKKRLEGLKIDGLARPTGFFSKNSMFWLRASLLIRVNHSLNNKLKNWNAKNFLALSLKFLYHFAYEQFVVTFYRQTFDFLANLFVSKSAKTVLR